MSKIWLVSKLQNLAMKKKEAYVTRSVTLPMIDKETLLDRAAANSGIRRGTIYQASDAIFNEIQNFLLNGHSIQVPVLGTFRFGVNAHASDTEADAGSQTVYRRKILYTPTVQLKRQLQAVNLESIYSIDKDKPEGDGAVEGDENNG